MKKVNRFGVSLIALSALFLAGCGNEEYVASSTSQDFENQNTSLIQGSDEDSLSEEPSGPQLTDDHIQAISGENITFSGTSTIGSLEGGTSPYETTVRYADGYWQGVTENSDYGYYDIETFYRTSDGYLAQSVSPDINNETVAYDTTTLWSESIFSNMFYAFEASWFEYDEEYSDEEGRNRYVMTSSALASDDVYYAEVNLFSSLAEYTVGSSYSGDLQYFYFYTDADNENIVSFELYESSYGYSDYMGGYYTCLTDISMDVINIGSTQIDETSLYSPYSIPSGQETEYAAFESAVSHLKEHNYTANVECIDVENENHVYQESTYQVTEEGYSGFSNTYAYDATTEERSLTDSIYFGTHKAEEGRWDYYEGYTVDNLIGLAYAGSNAWYYLADHDFATEIFELDEDASSENSYVFKLRSDYMDHYSAYYVASQFTTDYLRYFMEEYYELGYNFTVSISSSGYIESFEFIYYDYTNEATFRQTYSNWGTTSVTTDVADFTNYTAYVLPTFDNTYVYNNDDYDAENESYSQVTLREALVMMYGEETGNQIPDFMDSNPLIASTHGYSVFSPVTNGVLQICFDYFWTNYDFDELEDGYYAVADALIEAGATLVEDDDYYKFEGTMLNGTVDVSVFISGSYYVVVEFSL